MDNNWRKKLTTSDDAEAWCYYSKSGKRAEVYVRLLDIDVRPILSKPIRVVVPCYPPKGRKSKAGRS